MKVHNALKRLMLPISSRNTYNIKRACKPISISAFDVSAVAESIITTSTALERTNISQILTADSSVSNCDTKSTFDLPPLLTSNKKYYIEVRTISASIINRTFTSNN